MPKTNPRARKQPTRKQSKVTRKPSPPPQESAPKASSRARGARLRFAPLALEQIPALVDILAGAYPMFMTNREKSLESFHEIAREGYPELIGVFDGHDRMVGGYASYDFVATILGRGMPACGLGMVGTALDRKKQHIALELVRNFVKRSRARKMPLTLLYPFRHDFYGDMGWGAVGEMRQHNLRAASLPLFPERLKVRWVPHPQWEELDRIHRSSAGRQNSLALSRHPLRWKWILRQTSQVFLFGPEEAPEGYLLARFVKRPEDTDNFHYDLEVIEMEWTTPEAMRGFLGFLSSQRDQVIEVILNWPIDGHLEAILRDPTRRTLPHLPGHLAPGATVGHGVMLRLENPKEAFRDRPVKGTDRVDLRVTTHDPLFENREIQFRVDLRGEGYVGGPAQAVTLSAGLATLAQLWAGALSFTHAASFGLCRIEPKEACGALDRLFQVPPPWVVEQF